MLTNKLKLSCARAATTVLVEKILMGFVYFVNVVDDDEHDDIDDDGAGVENKKRKGVLLFWEVTTFTFSSHPTFYI